MLTIRRRKWTPGALIGTGVVAAGALVVVGVAFWPAPEPASPVASAEVSSRVAPQVQPLAPASSPVPTDEATDAAADADSVDLSLVCAALDEDQDRLPTQACFEALEARFLPALASRTVLPVSPPLVWSDVFQGVAAKIEAVDVALEDEACDVPEGEIRPERGQRCAARTMAELDVLRHACSFASVRFADPHVSLSPKGFDLRSLNLMHWDRVDRTSYRTNVDAEGRERALAGWGERAPDQEAWAAGKRRLDDLYYRTAWKRARCQMAVPMLRWMRGERWEGMLARAARLGDAFALAHHVGTPKHAGRLTALDAPQGLLHLASSELRAIRDMWRREDSDAGWRVVEEQHEDRIRLLKLAGIDCGDCTLKAVDRAFHHTYDYHFRECVKVQCANLEAMRELRAALMRPITELNLTESARSLPHRKRAEAAALKYALALQTLAEAAGVDVDSGLLRQLGDPDAPALLTDEEVERAREVAQLLAAAMVRR